MGYSAAEYKAMLCNHYPCSLLSFISIPDSLRAEHTLPSAFVVQALACHEVLGSVSLCLSLFQRQDFGILWQKQNVDTELQSCC